MGETVAEPAPAVDGAQAEAAQDRPTVAPPGAHPVDPFAAEYLPLPATRAGVAPGQLRVVGLVGAGYWRDVHLASQLNAELVAFPNLGVRGSLGASVPTGGTDAQLVSARVGPALHLLPYRTIDLGLFFEAGGAAVDLLRSRRTAMFTVAPGATFDIALGTYWNLHFEGVVQLGTADRDGRAELVCVPIGLVGLGPVL